MEGRTWGECINLAFMRPDTHFVVHKNIMDAKKSNKRRDGYVKMAVSDAAIDEINDGKSYVILLFVDRDYITSLADRE